MNAVEALRMIRSSARCAGMDRCNMISPCGGCVAKRIARKALAPLGPEKEPLEPEWLAAHLEAVITPDPDGGPGLYDMAFENGTRLTADQLRRVIQILRAVTRLLEVADRYPFCTVGYFVEHVADAEIRVIGERKDGGA